MSPSLKQLTVLFFLMSRTSGVGLRLPGAKTGTEIWKSAPKHLPQIFWASIRLCTLPLQLFDPSAAVHHAQ